MKQPIGLLGLSFLVSSCGSGLFGGSQSQPSSGVPTTSIAGITASPVPISSPAAATTVENASVAPIASPSPSPSPSPVDNGPVNLAPVVGTPELTVSLSTYDSFRVEWTLASDDSTAAENIKYEVFATETGSLVGKSESALNSYQILPGQAGIGGVSIFGKSGQKLWVFVRAIDAQGLRSAYTEKEFTQLIPIFVYRGPAVKGDIGGRAAADQKCSDHWNSTIGLTAQVTCSTKRALMSFSEVDAIINFTTQWGLPASKEVYSLYLNVAPASRLLVASSWTQFIDPNQAKPLSAIEAHLITAPDNFYRTFSNWEFKYNSGNSCEGGSLKDDDHFGSGGIATQKILASSDTYYCSMELPILCLCY